MTDITDRQQRIAGQTSAADVLPKQPVKQEPVKKDDVDDTGKLVNILTDIKPEANFEPNDMGFAQLFTQVFDDRCKYNPTSKEWFFYDGKSWKMDIEHMEISRLGKLLTNALMIYSTTIQDDKQRVAYQKVVSKYGQLAFRDTMIRDAKSNNYITADDLDKQLDLFNCQNGVFNLKTFEFTPHDSKQLLSKISNVVYDPKAKSPLWEKFISDVMEGDEQKVDYLQRICGYFLTADTSLECMWFFYGKTTRNGKSTCVETLLHMMGNSAGYGLTTNPETFAEKKIKDGSKPSSDLARLDGCRLLNAAEPPKRMLFDSSLVKKLIGRDTITARFLHQEFREFTPVLKLLFNTNYLPLTNDDSLFKSGRIVVVEFPHHFGEAEQDITLKKRLKSEENISGIFNWCLDGLRKFRQTGAPMPQPIKEATEEYRRNSDKIGLFFADRMFQSPKVNSAAGEVYKQYSIWCQDNGYATESKGSFFDDLRTKNLFADKGTISGKTVKNIVPGWSIRDNLLDD